MAVPPPVCFAAVFAAGYGLHRLVPLPLPAAVGFNVAGWILMAASGALVACAVVEFVRARTAILPEKSPTAMITCGPFRYTRNPMYLSIVLLHAGLSLVLGWLWPLLLLPLPVWVVQACFIRGEERRLEECFGEQYLQYARRVRRWL